MFYKKGQSALEFLTTYGWAFLVALIMIGALAYFGVLNPSKYLPERCSFGTEIGCTDFIVSENSGGSEISLSLMNNLGEAIRVTAITVNTTTPNQPGCILSGAPPDPWGDGQRVDIVFDCSTMTLAGVITGSKSKMNVKISYYAAKSSSTYTHNVFGEVYAQVN